MLGWTYRCGTHIVRRIDKFLELFFRKDIADAPIRPQSFKKGPVLVQRSGEERLGQKKSCETIRR